MVRVPHFYTLSVDLTCPKAAVRQVQQSATTSSRLASLHRLNQRGGRPHSSQDVIDQRNATKSASRNPIFRVTVMMWEIGKPKPKAVRWPGSRIH
jgi:hypothetical protein